MIKKYWAGACLAAMASTGAQAATVFGVDENNNLITFDSAAPGATLSSVALSGMGSSVAALDFRPINGVLYGITVERIVYTINTATGVSTALGGPLDLNGGTVVGFDFNPAIDRIRIVSDANGNYVLNPNDNGLTTATPVFYADGDVNDGTDPIVSASAYTSSTSGAPGASTQLYSIDTGLDVLTTQANSAGTLNTVGSLGFDLGSRTSFDIAESDAFVFNANTLYSINLGTGALTSLGNTDRSLFGIAISSPGAVPEPATWAMMLIGFGLVGYSARRRTRVRFAQAA